MIEVLKKGYWSKSQAFLVPLTGLAKTQKYIVESFLFWEDYSIENYQLILRFFYDDYGSFISYCKKNIFPILDKNGYLTEIFDGEQQCVFILDMSEWALDIEMFLRGKYSKLSKEAKDIMIVYHILYENKKPRVPPEINASLYPTDKFIGYGNMSPIEYVAENYGLDLKELRKMGELASQYDREKETLVDFYAKVAEGQ